MRIFSVLKTFSNNANNDKLALEEGAMDMMEKVFMYYKAGAYRDALAYIEIAEKMLGDAGYNNPGQLHLGGFMPPSNLDDVKTIKNLREKICCEAIVSLHNYLFLFEGIMATPEEKNKIICEAKNFAKIGNIDLNSISELKII